MDIYAYSPLAVVFRHLFNILKTVTAHSHHSMRVNLLWHAWYASYCKQLIYHVSSVANIELVVILDSRHFIGPDTM